MKPLPTQAALSMLHPLIVVPDVTWQRKAMMIAAPHKAGAPEAKGLPSINQPIMHSNLSETKQACRKDTFFIRAGIEQRRHFFGISDTPKTKDFTGGSQYK
jgi:hypothetical protein